MKQLLVVLFCLFSISILTAQQRELSPEAEISVLTVGPGPSLNDAFGHNGFRIQDPTFGIDLVFNYGVYDFGAPNFYLKFARGKLDYLIGLDYYQDFFTFYKGQNRSIKEQVLNLSQGEKQSLFDFLVENFKPENRRYLYDFFYDNCATRIRDVVEQNTENTITFKTTEEFEAKTFRGLIYEHVSKNTWGSFGIDLALGSVIDKEATPYEHMFLPNYIHQFFENAEYENGQSLVESSTTIFEPSNEEESGTFFLSPMFIISVLSIIIIIITYKNWIRGIRSKWLDFMLFTFTGLVGLILLLLWFATDHTATAFNYNLLWAFPLNIIVLGQVTKQRVGQRFIKYLKFLLIILVLIVSHWLIGVQVFAITLIPLLLAIAFRYVFLIRHYQNKLSS